MGALQGLGRGVCRGSVRERALTLFSSQRLQFSVPWGGENRWGLLFLSALLAGGVVIFFSTRSKNTCFFLRRGRRKLGLFNQELRCAEEVDAWLEAAVGGSARAHVQDSV